MKRRTLLAGAGVLATGAAMSFPAPAITQQIRRLTMVTDWTEAMPGLLPAARRFARNIGEVTKGRIAIEVFPADTFVRAFETFDAVSAGVADMYHSYDGYFERKSRALNFFAGVPFGFTANEWLAWVRYGGGQELWDVLVGQYDIKPLPFVSTGSQMGGWFNNEIIEIDGFRGLRYRMPGLGGEILRRLGAIVVSLPGGEIVPALRSGAIDASEWIGPWSDMAMGLHKAAKYYYYPGFHEPGTAQTLGINKRVWESFDASDQRLLETAAIAGYAESLVEFNGNNASSLRKLRQEGVVKISKFDDALLKALHAIAKEVVAEAGAGDELSKKIYASYQRFRALIMDWSDISERAYLNSRALS
jgi:TRAP-type mannitol/chloroaromatic compound transport system substrate-binding protein